MNKVISGHFGVSFCRTTLYSEFEKSESQTFEFANCERVAVQTDFELRSDLSEFVVPRMGLE